MTKLFKGKITISRVYGGGHDPRIHIMITEDNSGIEFFDGIIPLDAFGALVTGASYQPIEFEFRPDKVGWKAENKTELVPKVDVCAKNKKELIAEALKPFEVDGWSARESDMENMHCRVGDKQRVVFSRHVQV